MIYRLKILGFKEVENNSRVDLQDLRCLSKRIGESNRPCRIYTLVVETHSISARLD